MLLRLVTHSPALVALAQLVAVVLTASWLHGQGHLWHGLPSPDLVRAFNNLLFDARMTVQNYAAPAPTDRGIILGVGLALGLTAIIVDHLAVMRRSPAMAGLPLLTAFLISASNSGASLHPIYFLAAGSAVAGDAGPPGRRVAAALEHHGAPQHQRAPDRRRP